MNRLTQPRTRSALAECGQLNGVRLWARVVTGALFVLAGGSFVTPWTQTVSGEGKVIAYSPVERETPIRAPMDGRIADWYVNEGEWVEAGQLLAELRDNDPNLLERLGQARDAALAQGRAMQSAVRVAREQVEALNQARDAALANATQQVRIAEDRRDSKRQDLIAARARRDTAAMNLARQERLNRDSLSSDRELELARLAADTANADLASAEASLRASERAVRASGSRVVEIRQKNQARIEKARGELAKLEAEGNKVTASVASAETKLSRQERMFIHAPRAGRILSIVARAGSDFVKSGQSLAVLVPDTDERAVEIWVDGNDAPLIGAGRHVRLQFEGWPAVQFVGWPSVAVGTFGGQVAFVDAAASKDGRFRVVVVPEEGGDSWPSSQYLRQGVRVRGWVLLNQVTVAFELWRQLNGFPPATEPQYPNAGAK